MESPESQEIRDILREARQAQELSLEDLGRKLQRTHSYVAQVEGGGIRLNAKAVWDHAVALYDYDPVVGAQDIGVQDREAIFSDPISRVLPPAPFCAVHRANGHEGDQIKRRSAIDAGELSYRELTPSFPGNLHRCVAITIDGKAQYAGDIDAHFHPGEEFFLVTHGEIDVQIFTPRGPTDWLRLSASDARHDSDYVWFPAHMPHRYRKSTSGTTTAIAAYLDPRGDTPISRRKLEDFGPTIVPKAKLENQGFVFAHAIGIGLRLSLFRQRAGLRLQELAKRSHVPTRSLSQIEKGELVPKLDHVIELAKSLDVPPRKLFGEVSPLVIHGTTKIPPEQIRCRHQPPRPSGAWIRVRDLARVPGQLQRPILYSYTSKRNRDTWVSRHAGQELVYVIRGDLEFLSYDVDIRDVSEFRRGLFEELTELLRTTDKRQRKNTDPGSASQKLELLSQSDSLPLKTAQEHCVRDTQKQLEDGDSILVDSTFHHTFRARGDDPCLALGFHFADPVFEPFSLDPREETE